MTDWNEELKKASEKAMEGTSAIIRKDGPSDKPYCVYSETTGKKFGCYPSKKKAQERLNQIKMFKHIKGENANGECEG